MTRPVTAETLSDEDIAGVYRFAVGPGSHQLADPDLMHACTVARNAHGDFTGAERASARARIAAAINARGGAR